MKTSHSFSCWCKNKWELKPCVAPGLLSHRDIWKYSFTHSPAADTVVIQRDDCLSYCHLCFKDIMFWFYGVAFCPTLSRVLLKFIVIVCFYKYIYKRPGLLAEKWDQGFPQTEVWLVVNNRFSLIHITGVENILCLTDVTDKNNEY